MSRVHDILIASDVLAISGFSIAVPWENSPSQESKDYLKTVFRHLDVNGDGHLAFVPDLVSSTYQNEIKDIGKEMGKAEFNRAFRSFARTEEVKENLRSLYETKVKTQLTSTASPEAWRAAIQIYSTLGDWERLYQIGNKAIGVGSQKKSSERLIYVETARDALMASLRFSSFDPKGRDAQGDIEKALHQVLKKLDRDLEAKQKEWKSGPYLLAGPGSPVTVALSENRDPQTKDVRFDMGLAFPSQAVPPETNDVRKYVKEYLNHHQTTSITQWTAQGERRYFLRAVSVKLDKPTSKDDPVTDTFNYHLDQNQLAQGLFPGQDVLFYRVTFSLEDAEGNPPAWVAEGKYDLEIVPENGGISRHVSGGVVLKNYLRGENKVVMASDLHISLDDWKNVKLIIDRLKKDIEEGKKVNPSDIEAVERHYASATEKVIAFCEKRQGEYKAGEIQSVILLGDIVDYQNIILSIEKLGYHFTNVHLFHWIIDQYDFPVYIVNGNHDHHGSRFPLSFHPAYFPFTEWLEEHARDTVNGLFRFQGGLIDGMNSVGPYGRTNAFDFALLGFIPQLLHLDPSDWYEEMRDGDPELFINAFTEHVAPYECYAVDLSPKRRGFFMPSGSEQIDIESFFITGYKEFTKSLYDDADTLWEKAAKLFDIGNVTSAIQDGSRHGKFNGFGPGGDNLLALANHAGKAKAAGKNLTLFSHFPVFNHVTHKKHEALDKVDIFDEGNRWVIRMLADYFRDEEGHKVIDLMVSGHVHIRSAVDAAFRLSPQARKQYDKKLAAILRRQNPDTFIADMLALRDEFKISDGSSKLRTTRHESMDDHVGGDFKTTFATVDGAGRNVEGDETGSADLIIRDGHKPGLAFRNLYVDELNRVKESRNLANFRRERSSQINEWIALNQPERMPNVWGNNHALSFGLDSYIHSSVVKAVSTKDGHITASED